MKNIRGIALSVSLAAIICTMLVGSFRAGVAHADTGSAVAGSASDAGSGAGSAAMPIPDPLAHPADTLSMMSKLYHSGAFFALGIVVLFCLLYVLDKKIAWLREGKRGVYIAAALGALATVVGPATQGTSPNASMIVAVVTTAVALILNPTKTP